MPPIPGMRTSSIRQSALASWSEVKNSSADANALTANPTDLSNPQRASRTDSSSSTTEIRWTATQQNDHFYGTYLLYLRIKTNDNERQQMTENDEQRQRMAISP